MSRHQRGYIYEAFGAFHVRYYATENGERKQRSHRLCTKDRATGHGSPSAKDVRAICEDFMRTVNTDTPTPTPVSIVQFWNDIYMPFIEANLKHSTVKGYQQVWNQHLKKHFGTSLLTDYKTPTMTNFLTSLSKTLRPRTLNSIKCLASSIFAHAVATGQAPTNPIRDAMVLGRGLENGKTESYTLEEIENVISALVEHVECQLIMALCFFLGLRKGEIQGLQWGDFDEKFCYVRRAVGRGRVGTPKTLKSVRRVPLIAPVRVFLGLWRQKCNGSQWVFPSQNETPKSLDLLARSVIQPSLERAGLSWKGYHAGRRGLGTTLRMLTGNSNAGRDMLGHSTSKVTEEHYEDAMPEEVLKGMRLLEAKTSENLSSNLTPHLHHQQERQTR